MNQNLLIAVGAGLTGMLGWGFADFFAKKTIDEIGDLGTLAWAHIYGGVALGIILIYRIASGTTKGFPGSSKEILALASFGALQAAVYFFAYRAFSKGKLALLNPVFSSYSALVVVLSVIVFGEVLSRGLIAVLISALVGIAAINLDPSSLARKRIKLIRQPGMAEILTATLLAALWTTFWGRFVAGKDWLVYAAFMYIFMAVTILLKCFMDKQNLRLGPRALHRYFLAIGLSEVGAYIGVSLGYGLTSHLSVVAVLSSAFAIPTLLLSRFFLREQVSKLQYGGIILVVTGAVLASLL